MIHAYGHFIKYCKTCKNQFKPTKLIKTKKVKL
jgi:hypothetical protein